MTEAKRQSKEKKMKERKGKPHPIPMRTFQTSGHRPATFITARQNQYFPVSKTLHGRKFVLLSCGKCKVYDTNIQYEI